MSELVPAKQEDNSSDYSALPLWLAPEADGGDDRRFAWLTLRLPSTSPAPAADEAT